MASSSVQPHLAAWQQQLHRQYGPWALITGASDGIGKAIAQQLAACGFHLCLVARNKVALEALAKQWQAEHGIEVKIIAVDLADPNQQALLAQQLQAIPIGLLVASAGFGSTGSFLDAPLANELAMVEVNCKAIVHLCHHVGQRLRQQGKGGIILMSSLVAFQGAAGAVNYAATKAFVQSFAEGLAMELGSYGVDVLASAPGPVHTGFASRAAMNMQRAASPTQVAQETLQALGRQQTVFPSWLAKGLGFLLTCSPRWLRIRIMSNAMHNMATKSAAT